MKERVKDTGWMGMDGGEGNKGNKGRKVEWAESHTGECGRKEE